MAWMRPLTEMLKTLDWSIDVVHPGSCVKVAKGMALCPIDFDALKPILETKFGVDVVLRHLVTEIGADRRDYK